MRKSFLFLFFVFTTLKADYLYIGYYMDATDYSDLTFFDKDYRSRCYPDGNKLKIGKDIYIYSQKTSYPHLGSGKTYIPQFEPNCLNDYAVRKCSWDHTPYTPNIAGFWEGNYMYCLKKEGYSYSKSQKIWVKNSDADGATVICPPDKFNINDKCVEVCPADSVYFTWKDGNNYCVEKDDFSTLSKIFNVNLDNCKYDDKYYTINKASSIKLVCDNEYVFLPYADNDVSINSNDSNLTEPTTIKCDGSEDAVIDENGNITCVPVENNTTQSSDSDNFDTSNENSDNSDSSSTDTDSKNDSNSSSDSNSTVKKECPDPCKLKNSVGTEIRVQGSCYIITKPHYDGCVLMYHNDDGRCVPGCNNADVGGDVNATIDVSSITTRLDSLNQKVNDFMNLEPDGTYNPEATLTDDESAIYSQFSTFYNNAKSTVSSTIDSLNKLVEIAKNKDSYKVTLFNNEITSCPLTAKIYGSKQTIDICSFISPFRPILQTFFTILFNFSVLLGFFKVVIFRKV